MAYSGFIPLVALSAFLAGCSGTLGADPAQEDNLPAPGATDVEGNDPEFSDTDGSGGSAASGGSTNSGGTGGDPTAGGTGGQTGGSGGGDPAPSCEGVECGNGSCVISDGSTACACDLGWLGESCDEEVVNGCDDTPCSQGVCTDEGSGSYSCECSAGYSGANCDTNIDDCEVNPCVQGTCVDAVDAFSCECEPGFEGSTCSNNIDDCALDPCQNGTCSDDIDAYSCTCDFGWTGSTCDEVVNSCLDSPCGQGSCIDVAPGQYTCECETGWGGINCDACATDYTLEGGDCIRTKQVPCEDASPQNAGPITQNVTISYTTAGGWAQPAACDFECNAGWTGNTCNQSVNDCPGNECQNGATCVDGHLGYSCDCPSGFSGERCETNVDNCAQSPCDHGSCEDGVNSYTCDCDPGWAGDNCGTCATDFTLEGGQCIQEKSVSCVDASPENGTSTPGSVTITYSSASGWSTPADCSYSCNAGWTGNTCSQSENDCPGNSCQNGATCVDEHQDYSCDCATGYTGRFCNTNIDDCAGAPCNGSTCVDGVNSFTCNCNQGYAGQLCNSCATNYIDEGGGCINQKGATCVDVAPQNAVSVPMSVTLNYSSNSGWSTPPNCSFVCEDGWTGNDCSESTNVVHVCDDNETQCVNGGLQVCSNNEWSASSCSNGQVCVGDRCIDEDANPVELHGHLAVENGTLVDESGSPVQLRGVSTHWLNFADTDNYETNAQALVWMRDNWDLSVIRAAMGVEEAGGYLTSDANKNNMLADIDDIVNNAVAAGVYVIIDWHTHATQSSGAQQFFDDMVGLYGHLPNVLYETYNEPLDLSWQNDLKPYHEAVLSRIRSRETQRGLTHPGVVLMGTPNWSQDVDDVINNEVSGTNLMYTVHFYSCTHGSNELGKAQDALREGIPIFVTEWGATEANGGIDGTSTCEGAADTWHNWMDNNSISWAAWKLDDCDWEISTRGVADTSCLLEQNVSASGGWATNDLNGHGAYVRDKMMV